MRFDTTAALLGLAATALAADLTLYLPAVPNPAGLPPTTHATLTSRGTRRSAPVTASNTFVFRNVTAPASYLADVHCPTDGFQPLRVDVAADGSVQAWETFRGNEWDNKGEALAVRAGATGQGVEVRALGSKNYFVERPKFSVLSILKNPMILMGLVSMVMFVGMPYIMDNMDPEMKAEIEERQRNGPMAMMAGGQGAQQQNSLGNFDMAAYLAGSGKKEGGGGGGGGGGSAKSQGVRR